MQTTRYRFPALLGAGLALAASAAPAAECLYVSSYHQGYHWNDRVEAALAQALAGKCALGRFYLDTLRHQEEEFAKAQAALAQARIAAERPAVVIACDDPASKYLVMPYLKDAAVPVVFCGVNWTVEAYGYPYANATGMIEVAPIQPLLREAKGLLPAAATVAFVTAEVPTQHKEAARLDEYAAQENLRALTYFAKTQAEWEDLFGQAQQADFVVLGNPSGIAGWDDAKADAFLQAETRRLTVSFGVAMSRRAVFAMTNVPEEQGEWAGETAALILEGGSPAEIPIVANRRWQLYANPPLAAKIGVALPERLLLNAIKPE